MGKTSLFWPLALHLNTLVAKTLVNWTVLRCIMGYFLDRCLIIINFDNLTA